MFAPLEVISNFKEELSLIIAFFIGIGFGFFLEQGGFGNSRKLALQFYFRDMTVFKVMFTAIITAMTGLILFNGFGWIDLELIYINPTYLWPGIIGGLIMGAGFVIGGYCPGTSFVGLVTLKTDALFYLIGAFFGIFVFGEIIPSFYGFFNSGFLGDSLTLHKALGVSAGVIGFFVILMALGGFWGAETLEKKFGERRPQPINRSADPPRGQGISRSAAKEEV
ncbi:MAG: YeeE/YedE family protein [Candidatus Aminicenantes bacterium]|nr:YeeE/YedE family protein [Candidatus Aminicenantes bacterium]